MFIAPGPRKGSQYDLVSRSRDEYIGNLSETYPISIPTYISYNIIPNLVLLYTTDMIANAKLWYLLYYTCYMSGKQNRREQLASLEAQLSSLGVCEIFGSLWNRFYTLWCTLPFSSGIFLLAAAPRFFPHTCRREYKMVYGGGPPVLRLGVFVRRWPWYLNNMCSLRANLAKVSGKYYPPWVLLSQAHSYTCLLLTNPTYINPIGSMYGKSIYI